MAWFKKRREVIDLTYLAKRGLIKVPETEEYKDISVPSPSYSSQQSSSPFSFLSSMASSAEQEKSPAKQNAGINPNKLDDIEYKLDAMSKRISAVLDRLDLVEKKIARDLRQGSG